MSKSGATEQLAGVSAPPSQKELATAARRLADTSGLYLGQNKILRMALKFKALRPQGDTSAFLQWLVNEVNLSAEQRQRAARSIPQIARVISYSDPLGETALNDLLHGRKP
jgi:hypothetical protein